MPETTAAATEVRCPHCDCELQPAPVVRGALPHYPCPECRCIWVDCGRGIILECFNPEHIGGRGR